MNHVNIEQELQGTQSFWNCVSGGVAAVAGWWLRLSKLLFLITMKALQRSEYLARPAFIKPNLPDVRKAGARKAPPPPSGEDQVRGRFHNWMLSGLQEMGCPGGVTRVSQGHCPHLGPGEARLCPVGGSPVQDWCGLDSLEQVQGVDGGIGASVV